MSKKAKKENTRKIIAVETSSRIMSVALAENDRIVSEYYSHHQFDHSEKLLPALQWLLREQGWDSGPDMLVVDIGPGSFTGIRIGVSAVRGLAQAWKIPVRGISSLDVLAEAVGTWDGTICCMIDALRGEVFEARYNGDQPVKKISSYQLVTIENLINSVRKTADNIFFIGTGAMLHAAYIKNTMKEKAFFAQGNLNMPSASMIAKCAERTIRKSETYKKILPFYIRMSAAEERLNSGIRD